MTGALYNHVPLSPNTLATAEQLNAEFIKIQSAVTQLETMISAITETGSLPSYTWRAFADSIDGTANFTTGEAGDRSFIGFAYNKAVVTPSTNPEDYEWTQYRGSDGSDGSGGGYVEYRFRRQAAKPALPSGVTPADWATSVPTGTDRLWTTFASKAQDGSLLSAWADPFSTQNFLPRGEYSAAIEYYDGDIVFFEGGSYFAKAETQGNAPSGTAQENAWWAVVAAPGARGEPATPETAFTATIDLTSGTTINLRTVADTAGYTGASDATITFNVPSGVTITGSPFGSQGIDTGSWPAGYAISLALVVQNGGKVYGGGGAGGAGGSGASGSKGGNGGDAIYCRTPIAVTIDVGGEVKAGGGGGGGGAGSNTGAPEPVAKGGSGGGGGYPNGAGGYMGNGDFGNGNPGSPGSLGGGGIGGAAAFGQGAAGANGGGVAAVGGSVAGASGGAAGYAVRKNGFTVPVTNNGTVAGATA
ncbi:hypothetical protein [Sphingobium xenophagum]|uniref:hypothetical protein n=1 Tax=Sphingobium xenophagum TaxID=121428 RepID=UPI00031FB839|nr:hypothetical protein [Sphingobium xenophagum]